MQRRRAAGEAIRAIARAIPLAPGTVRRDAATDRAPERGARAIGPSILDPWLDHLERRLAQGCENGLQLVRELRQLGYQGGSRPVPKWLQSRRTRPARTTPRRWQELEGEAAPRSAARLPGPKALAWIMALPRARQSAIEGAVLAQVRQDPEAATLHGLVQRFVALGREAGVSCCSSAASCTERVRAFEAWVAEVSVCGIRAAETFAASLVADGAAVRAALTTPWSKAQAEGQITKLKLIKRLMYGRAGFDLLRRCILLAV